MAFLGPNDILVLEKNDGTVRRIVNGYMLPNPLLHVNVDNRVEGGLLGIAIASDKNVTKITKHIFLYYLEKGGKLVQDFSFTHLDNHTGELPLYWIDPVNSCGHIFRCTTNFVTGLKYNNNSIKNNNIFQLSTNIGDNDTWSWIYGKEIDVNPGERYLFVSHMKLNEFAVQSHIAVEGYNETSKKWNQFHSQCPSGINGPLEWHEYSCEIKIPANTTKIRPVLNAGWSSQPGKEAVTWFQSVHLNLNESNIRLYKYELVNNSLTNPKLLMGIPVSIPTLIHYGGKIIIGPDKNLYVVVGNTNNFQTTVQNNANGSEPDGTGGILRMTQDGKLVGKGILGDKYPLNLYYAYGIRNSFGINFDPLSGKLWDTENGPAFGDEINLVDPGFNSGWNHVQGIWKPQPGATEDEAGPIILHPEKGLIDFSGKGKYHHPQFMWFHTVGPTALAFLNSAKLRRTISK